MKTTFLILIFGLSSIVNIAQDKPQTMNIESLNKPWTSLDFNNNPQNFHFVVTPDHTGAHRAGILLKGIERINLLQPQFVVSVGDLIEGYTLDRNEIDTQWDEFNNSIQKLQMPFFYVAGNHDYTNQTMADLWQHRYGTSYYYFVYKNVLFLCLNSEDGATGLKNPDFSKAQLAFVEKTLAENPKVNWTMVFMHQPLWLTPTAKNWQTVELLLSNRNHSVFTGHTHQYALHKRNNNDYFVLSTMGGVNTLRGKKQGEFDHFLWVSMTPNGPTYANILLDGVEDKSIQTAEDLERTTTFNAQPPVRFEPYYYTEIQGEKSFWKINLNNNTNENHQYQIQLLAGTGLQPQQTTISKQLNAGMKEDMTIPVRMAQNEKWTPVIANITVQAEKYEWKTQIHVLPYKKLFIDETKKAILIDGELSEWNHLRFSKQDSIGTTGFRFDVRKDERFVYIAIDVTDKDIQAPSTHANLNQDGAYIVFDASPIATSAFNLRNSEGMGREWLFMIASPTANDFELGFKQHMPAGLTGKGKITNKGYAIEYAIPQELLQKLQGLDWKNLRLNIVVADLNTDSKGVLKRISWTPDWIDNYPGSGMFFRK